ncbi:MAG: hypothetical protein KIT57_24540 [Blastocatellales bacterium]|nr:hypothetical protein [Blastocatellales bacterium]MCW5971686.1 hypothetical protein [Blastocatellales bacterium]
MRFKEEWWSDRSASSNEPSHQTLGRTVRRNRCSSSPKYASIRHIQQLLGHDKLETTERYTHLTTEDLKAAITAAHERIAEKIVKP